MAKKKESNILAGWAFLVALLIAVVLGPFITIGPNVAIALVVIGLIVGLLNVSSEEASSFMMSGAVLVVVTALSGNVLSGVWRLSGVLEALLLIFVPATIVVSVKNAFSVAKN